MQDIFIMPTTLQIKTNFMVKNLLPSCIREGIYCYRIQAKAYITIMLQRYTHKMRIHNEYSANVQSKTVNVGVILSERYTLYNLIQNVKVLIKHFFNLSIKMLFVI